MSSPASRPLVVYLAAVSLTLAVAVQIATVFATAATAGPVTKAFAKAFQGTASKDPEIVVFNYNFQIGQSVAFAVLFLAVAAALIFWRSNVARGLAFLVIALAVSVSLLGLISSAGNSVLGGTGNQPPLEPITELGKLVAEATPSWAVQFGMMESVATLGLAVLAGLLLVLPAANAFYRRNASAGSMAEARLAG